MGKSRNHRPAPTGDAPAQSSDAPSRAVPAPLVVAVIAVVIGALVYARSGPPGSTPSQSSPAPPLTFFADNALRGFSASHNASLLWGTYRPGVYFGVRSLTAPTGLAAGLMWSAAGTAGMSPLGKLRHQCEQDEVERYGFSAHDGRGFGVQPILDNANGIELRTSFLATGDGGWSARIEGMAPPGRARGKRQSLFFYLSVDGEFDDAPRGGPPGGLSRESSLPFQKAGAARISGHVRSLGRFSVLAEAVEGGGGAGGARVHMWGSAQAGASHLKVAEIVRDLLSPGPDQTRGARQPKAASEALDDTVEDGSQLVVLQLLATPPFTLDVQLVPGQCKEGGGDGEAVSCAAAHAARSGDALSEALSSRQSDFRLRLSSQLMGGKKAANALMLRGQPLDESAHEFAASALSAQLGSMGFFYGSSAVAPPAGSGDAPASRTPNAPLLAVVPSRPFFPRGFLWDEGFHQLVVGAWDEDLASHIFASWISLMHEDGWIPREQILGAEALARVPSQFVPQHRQHANPPALLLRIQRLLDSGENGKGDAVFGAESAEVLAAYSMEDGATVGDGKVASPRWLPLLRVLWPSLVRWHEWFARTQAGELADSFRWRGRDASDERLNAMTLSSGLDDYPRATFPSDKERHVDLHCWVAFFTRLLGQLAARLGYETEAAAYDAQFDRLLAALVKHHWSAPASAFCDFGQHANAGDFTPLYVVKCATADGRASVEHGVADPRRPRCPSSHPVFQFPLGDGKGGLLTRLKFAPRGAKLQHVRHLGYVSLFPLMLKLLPPDAPQLPHVLELLRDSSRLWSDHGVRSLSASDLWYGKENAPGDAPYWRGPIWVNLNYLVLGGLRHYADVPGPSQERAATIYAELRDNLVGNMLDEWKRTGYFWEQYDPTSGAGARTHPFNGWSSLALLALAEIY